jgi:hypothetical protein
VLNESSNGDVVVFDSAVAGAIVVADCVCAVSNEEKPPNEAETVFDVVVDEKELKELSDCDEISGIEVFVSIEKAVVAMLLEEESIAGCTDCSTAVVAAVVVANDDKKSYLSTPAGIAGAIGRAGIAGRVGFVIAGSRGAMEVVATDDDDDDDVLLVFGVEMLENVSAALKSPKSASEAENDVNELSENETPLDMGAGMDDGTIVVFIEEIEGAASDTLLKFAVACEVVAVGVLNESGG